MVTGALSALLQDQMVTESTVGRLTRTTRQVERFTADVVAEANGLLAYYRRERAVA